MEEAMSAKRKGPMSDEVLRVVREEIAIALGEAFQEAHLSERRAVASATRVNNDAAQRLKLSTPIAIASMCAPVLLALGGWTMSLSNRVAVLESDSTHLQAASVQIAAMNQELSAVNQALVDLRREIDAWKVEVRTKPGFTYQYPDGYMPPRGALKNQLYQVPN